MTETILPAEVPKGLDAPIEIGTAVEQFEVWSGKTKFRQKGNETAGQGRVFLDILPVPEFRFEFTPEPPLGAGVLECGPLIGAIDCHVTQTGEVYSGHIEGQANNNDALPSSVASAVYIVINGPNVNGSPIRRANQRFCGRMTAKAEGVEVIVDRLASKKQERRCIYDSTHVVRCAFSDGATIQEVDTVSTNLFRSLSLMKCRWVGLLGPWLYDSSEKEIGFRLSMTKTMRNDGTISWCHETMGDCFAEFFPSVFSAFTNEKRSAPLQTALHWLIEAEQCAGGVEGAIILQQAALECLAWLEVVKERRLCSESGFKSLPASDKIRWLLSLHQIEAAIPDKSDPIRSYAKAFNLTDLIDVLVDVRNALVHAEPKKADRLFGRNKGDEERSDLWHQVGGILQQAVLASIGYNGVMLRRDVDSVFAASAVRRVPWAEVGES